MTMQIGLVGVGFIGRGIATWLVSCGILVKVHDLNLNDSVYGEIETFLREIVDHNCAPPSILHNWRDLFRPVKSFSDFADCDFVIESVAENQSVKQSVFDELEKHIRPDVPLVTNTSAIPISLLQKSRNYPQRFAGMHWMGPAHVSPFIEVIRGEQTSDETIQRILALAKQIGKEPALINRDIEGFVLNRLCYAMYREALHLLSEGYADAETIDRSWRSCAGAWSSIAGPFRWMDLTGTSLYAAGMRRIFPTLCNSTDVPAIMQKLENEGAMGTANGRGFYQYPPQEAQKWSALLREQMWRTRILQDKLVGQTKNVCPADLGTGAES